jgi:hypothetical protein
VVIAQNAIGFVALYWRSEDIILDVAAASLKICERKDH